mmetsp:Transcript_12909/g.28058  ORF Transcript_12909/g.28058 Transcript_12909/m.28058 type:complete len:451 (+) Transcript_12909:750-2102(+)|eukprot:CAMPEP_0172296940 /NCGR_PEP_ID=MMETSP1058-20130122/113_1 /TAXON_ID=83371 /ORGANISM="Detonula confervacea, Strain CCMP 353" /LENGTH=450 /DNA_ID=CAMNT_0013006021 /DNA_START=540 /DNA_END=1892 /DNA_ORIENTATION=+
MCKLLKAEPVDNLYLSTGGERGVCLNKSVKRGDAILSIPISSCFRDDEPPRWYEQRASSHDEVEGGGDANENDITDYEKYNPSAWASRLAASVLDMELNQGGVGGEAVDRDLKLGREIWQSMLPDKDILHASLPVHWGEEVLATSKCTALELAVDSAYFARASAVTNLSEELNQALDSKDGEGDDIIMTEEMDIVGDMETLQRKCHDALDIVQTRACRVERTCEDGVQWGPPLRILAPIFDFINHGSSRTKGKGSANASFGIENKLMCNMHDAKFVVRAARDILEGEEVLIDYGDSARPAWRCLTSYGFVPEYDAKSEVVDEEQVENVAELWMNGLRFEVDTQSVPFDLVEVAAAQALYDDSSEDDNEREGEEDGILTPFVAQAIAKRATEAAFNLILEPEMVETEKVWDSPEFVHAMSLAALLRWSQHKVLLAFAENLNEFSSSPSEAE